MVGMHKALTSFKQNYMVIDAILCDILRYSATFCDILRYYAIEIMYSGTNAGA